MKPPATSQMTRVTARRSTSSIAPTRHFVFARPNNDPDLENPVLWLNHLGLEADREVMEYFPERRGYLMFEEPAHPENVAAYEAWLEGPGR